MSSEPKMTIRITIFVENVRPKVINKGCTKNYVGPGNGTATICIMIIKMAEMPVFNVAGKLNEGNAYGLLFIASPRRLILNKFRIYGIFGGENLASCLAG